MQLRSKRKEVARILTELRKRELEREMSTESTLTTMADATSARSASASSPATR
jgi:hypothetical protein